jgi:hypothetical protein
MFELCFITNTCESITTLRELTMMSLMNEITDKPAWNTKVFDQAMTAKWRSEALAKENIDISEKMVDWVRLHVVLLSEHSTELLVSCGTQIQSYNIQRKRCSQRSGR